ncbi:type 1 fimbrial protein [Pseudomonas sp. LJDD11]|uniref:type 1 fimbrial protein n=1 Tax=unclassified Pseudomonas TaxID=196821 RepID=UPI0020983EA9|nr:MULTISPECIES: type 1 fimbrial protein [unclassified Pseudomonas]MCO8162951.1 type 1 fimbrial protein [Pseudomonas sp. 21LCFQ010]MCQ9424525.1 type 1 fimbrial protein [Pseudomonas sp. LJDD11]
MSWKSFGLGLALFSSLGSACLAAPSNDQGVIRFHGSVVEAPCSASSSADGWRLDSCTARTRAPRIDVRRLDTSPVNTPTANAAVDDPSVQARLIASNTQGRYYNQQYRLVGRTGETLTTGHYLVTLTEP